MSNTEENENWVTEKIRCDLCAYTYLSVHLETANVLECPNCNNMTNYAILETYTKNTNERTK